MKYLVSALVLMFFSCSQKQKMITNRLSGMALGTSYNIIYISDTTLKVKEDINKLYDTINKVFSTYTEDSEISKINLSKTYYNTSEIFRKVFLIAKEIHRNTDGYFDPTVGILVRDLGLSSRLENIKKGINKEEYRELIGFDKITLNNNVIEKKNKNIFIDFNAIAKGYTVDLIAEYFDSKKVDNYLIEIGGEVVAKGKKINDKDWVIGIDKPKENLEERELDTVLTLKNEAVATSGNYRKFIIDSLGNKIVHTINPNKIDYEPSKILSVSVFHKKCVYSDAYATALMACGKIDIVREIVKKNNLDVIVIYLDEDNVIKKFVMKNT